jgi:hypothetical protein
LTRLFAVVPACREDLMRNAGNFHPEWGYLAPAPSFARTARIAIVAAVIGATAGSAVVFSLVDRPDQEETVAARTLAQPADAALAVANVATAATVQVGARTPPAVPSLAQDHGRAIRTASSESGTVSTTQRLTGATGLAEAPAINEAPPPSSAAEAAANEAAPANATDAQKKLAAKKPVAVSRTLPPQPAPSRGPLALLRSFGSQN